jgi:hypothetical protein
MYLILQGFMEIVKLEKKIYSVLDIIYLRKLIFKVFPRPGK